MADEKKVEAEIRDTFKLLVKTLAAIVHKKVIGHRKEEDAFVKTKSAIESMSWEVSKNYAAYIVKIGKALKKRVGE